VSISRVFSVNLSLRPRLSGLIVAICLAAACSPAAPSPAPAPPDPVASDPRTGAAEQDSDDRIWLEQPFGPDALLAVYFFADEAGALCLRFLVSTPGAIPVSGCGDPTREVMVAIQGRARDGAGSEMTIVTGRVFEARTRVVAIEMADGESFAVPVDEGGVILIAPGSRTAVQAVPIDEFGDLTGAVFRF
jgi:hypothetical protein